MFNYKWLLSDGYPAKEVEKHQKTVFSTFACGGGSSMGYKLAGYNVIGANDIDKQMQKVYIENHHPKHYFLNDIRDLLNQDFPEQFYNLDILDGSPPCSTFSMAGAREKNWGKEKTFREGQSKQILDDLFFEFIKLVDKLKPKIVIAENVKGMLQGNAKGYILEIKKQLNEIGYDVQIFLLNAASMGVPQKRERVFIICNRMNYPKLKLQFNEKPITFINIYQPNIIDRKLQPKELILWNNRKSNEKNLVEANKRLYNKDGYFKSSIIYNNKVCNTIIAGDALILEKEPRHLNKIELSLASTFPLDYNYLNIYPEYLVGMSVPPVMMAQVSYEVYKQWLKSK